MDKKCGKQFKQFSKRKQSDKYRKFKGNKQEGQGFADKRKRKIKHEYLKVLRKQKQQNQKHAATVYNEDSDTEDTMRNNKNYKRSGGKSGYTGAQLEYQKKKKEKDRTKKEFMKGKKERDTALEKYNEKKQNRHKTLCKKTYKGQPVMKNQIEYLLAKIQKQVNQT